MNNKKNPDFKIVLTNVRWGVTPDEMVDNMIKRTTHNGVISWEGIALFLDNSEFTSFLAMSESEKISRIKEFANNPSNDDSYKAFCSLSGFPLRICLPDDLTEDTEAINQWLEEKYSHPCPKYDIEYKLCPKRASELLNMLFEHITKDINHSEQLKLLGNIGFTMPDMRSFGYSKEEVDDYFKNN